MNIWMIVRLAIVLLVTSGQTLVAGESPGKVITGAAVLVINEDAAVSIARTIFSSAFDGLQAPDKKKFSATLHGESWVVEDAPASRRKWVTPVHHLEIDRRSGCISLNSTGSEGDTFSLVSKQYRFFGGHL